MIIKIKNHYDCEGACNLVENYYYDAKRIIDKIKKNRKYKKIYRMKEKRYDINKIHEIVEIFESSKYLYDLVENGVFDENKNCKEVDYNKINNIINKLWKYHNCDDTTLEKLEIITMFERLLSRQKMNPEERFIDYYDIKKIMKIIHNDVIKL